MQIVDVECLRDDWTDHPDLSGPERVFLEGLPDDELRCALDSAERADGDRCWDLIDSIRAAATAELLRPLTNLRDSRDAYVEAKGTAEATADGDSNDAEIEALRAALAAADEYIAALEETGLSAAVGRAG